ncbi:MAG: hypothetical protein WCN95_03350 [bacterium]
MSRQCFQYVRHLAVVSIVMLLLGSLVGVVWLSQNITSIPQYGDTSEYLELSKTLKCDQYRGILYPLLLNGSAALSVALGLPLQVIVYVVQVLVALFAAYSLAAVFLQRHSSARILSVFASVSIVFNPLIIHYSLTILTDSLATSFTLIFIVYLTKGCSLDVTSAKRSLYLICASFAFVCMTALRVEKLYLASLLFLVCLIGAIVSRRCQPLFRRAAVFSLMIVVFAIALGSSLYIRKATTVYNVNRPPLDLSSMAFGRAVWPRMSSVYSFLPDSLKQRITAGDAKQFDSHPNNVMPFLVMMLGESDGRGQIDRITLCALEHYPVQVVGRTIFDLLKYSIPNVAFPMEAVHVFPESVGTSWTISRLEMFTPGLSRILLVTGFIQFVVLLVFVVTTHLAASGVVGGASSGAVIWPANYELTVIYWILGTTVLLNSAMFTLCVVGDAHIRYALPVYTIIQSLVVTSAIVRSVDRVEECRRFVDRIQMRLWRR